VKGHISADRKLLCHGLFTWESAAKYVGISLPLLSCVEVGLTFQAERSEDEITLPAI